MSFSPTKYTHGYLWLFIALLGLGRAQNALNNSMLEDLHLQAQYTSNSKIMPDLIRRQRATSDEVLPTCLAPPQPANGDWKLDRFFCDDITDCMIPEGTALEPGSQMIFSCNPGYKLDGSTEAYCRATGEWSPIPHCIEVTCDSLNTVSTTVTCTRFGKWVNCDSPVRPDTHAEVTCRRGYKKDTGSISARRGAVNCNMNGKWVPEPIRCVPVCGRAITHQQTLVIGGSKANIGDFPWHATLFLEKTTQTGTEKAFICGATIIQTNLVLTAAHCVFDERTRNTTDPKKLYVMTGNIFRDYDSAVHNPDVVRKARVKNVYVHCNYYGLTGNYASDIALLAVEKAFEFTSILSPACLDDSGYSEQILEPGAIGRVAGFGRTATGTSSGILQTLTLPYIAYSQCRTSNNAAQNEAFISNDKFCAGYNNGSAVCEGDSGGGLVFKKGELWYVMGIVSVGLGVDIDNGEKTCDRYSYSLYTKVPNYMMWIQDVLFYVERNLPYPSCIERS